MTLVELMIALGIVGVVLLVCYSSSIALQRGFIYTSAWTEARINQERVLDSLALDLRNATKIDFTLPLPVIVTLTVPSRYSSYYQNAGDPSVKFNAAAGDPTSAADVTTWLWTAASPAPTAVPVPPPNQFGKIVYTNTISVTYTFSPDGTRISRKVVWTGGPAGGASRDVAIFPNRATVTFRASAPTTVITSITTSPDYRHPENPSILEDTVFLRECSMNTPTPTPTP